MKTLKYIFLAIAVMVAGVAAAQSEADFLLVTKSYKLNSDGSYSMRCVKQIKYNTHLSFNRLYGETFVIYNPQFQKLAINECYTIQHDGKKVEAPSNAFNEVLPSFATDAPAFNHLREMVVTHTGLELGATVYLDYTLTTQAGYSPLMVNEVLQEESPVKQYVVSVEAPVSQQIIYSQYNCGKPSASTAGGIHKITWTMKNIAPQTHDLYQPADRREAPRVAFASASGLEIAQRLLGGATPENAAIKSKVTELTSGKAEKEQIKAITDFVVNNISTVNIPLEYTGYQALRKAGDVYALSNGTPAEKTLLLANMLQMAGINAVPIIAMPVWAGNGTAAIPIANPDTKANTLDLWLAGNEEFAVMLTNNNVNYFVQATRTDAFTWNNKNSMCYRFDTDNRFLDNAARDAKIQYAYTISPMPDAKASELKLGANKKGNYGLTVAGNYRELANEADEKPSVVNAVQNGSYFTFTLPANYMGIDSWGGMQVLSATPRKTQLEIPRCMDEQYTYSCTIPAGYTIANRAVDVVIDKPVGKVAISIKPDAAKGTVEVTRNINLKKSIIDSKDYADFKVLMDAWFTATNRIVVLKKQ